MFDLLLGNSVLVTGLAEEEDGALRVYVGPRYRNVYTVIEDSPEADEVRKAWAQVTHVFITKPPDDALYVDTLTDTKEGE